MNAKNIIILCISLFLLYKFIISPVLTIVSPASRLNKLKDINKKMGNAVLLFEQQEIYSKKYKIFVYIFFIIIVALTLIFKSWLFGVFCIMYLSILLTFLANKKYSKVNGVYDKGIVLYDLYYWSDIHSWKKINENQISVLKKDGLRFDLVKCGKSEIISNIFIQNEISEDV